jgi:hypothetical protein
MNKKQLTDIEKRAGNGDNVDGFEVVKLCGEIRRLINALTECEGPHDMYDIAMDNIAAYSGKKK